MNSFIITGKQITITYNGEPYSVSLSESPDLYESVLFCIRQNDLGAAVNLISPKFKINASDDFHIENGVIYLYEGDAEYALPSDLCNTILTYIDEQLPTGSLINFAKKLIQNPSYRSVKQLFNFVQASTFTICEDGDFIAYKKVTDDFKDCHTKTIDNSVGKIVEMPRNMVDEDPASACSYGLHVATYSYAHGFAEGVVVFVKVNPKDVVSVPLDHDFQKMRVCKYEVIGLSKGELKHKVVNDTALRPQQEPEASHNCDDCDDCDCDDCDCDDCDCDCDDCDCDDCDCDDCDGKEEHPQLYSYSFSVDRLPETLSELDESYDYNKTILPNTDKKQLDLPIQYLEEPESEDRVLNDKQHCKECLSTDCSCDCDECKKALSDCTCWKK